MKLFNRLVSVLLSTLMLELVALMMKVRWDHSNTVITHHTTHQQLVSSPIVCWSVGSVCMGDHHNVAILYYFIGIIFDSIILKSNLYFWHAWKSLVDKNWNIKYYLWHAVAVGMHACVCVHIHQMSCMCVFVLFMWYVMSYVLLSVSIINQFLTVVK